LRLQNDSSVTKCRVVRHGNRSKESFVEVIAVIKDLGAEVQKIPVAVCVCMCVCVCMRYGTVQVLECSYTALIKYCF
jgi:hypothetical protein